jgi:hypothetical protein
MLNSAYAGALYEIHIEGEVDKRPAVQDQTSAAGECGTPLVLTIPAHHPSLTHSLQ